jgi:hypothetical protein
MGTKTTATSSRKVFDPPTYKVDGVSDESMSRAKEYIQAALTRCGDDNPLELMRVAASQRGVDTPAFWGLCVYMTFEYGLTPKDLGTIVRERAIPSATWQSTLRKICGEARQHRERLRR